MLLIHCREITPRLKYTLDLVFRDYLGMAYGLTTDDTSFVQATGPRLSYGDAPLGDEVHIRAIHLLFEKGIADQEIAVFDWEGTKAFFATDRQAAFPFDPFAASFFLVSRYEEYQPHIRDAHDRFDAPESLASQKNFLGKPVVNIWALRLRDLLLERYPGLSCTERKYRYISTIDIDNAFAYLEKGFMRTAGAYARSVLQLDLDDLAERTRVLAGLLPDPFDTYAYQLDMQRTYGFRCIYFTLLAEYGENDKNVPPDSRRLRSLIKYLADYAEVGIHPSYGSNRHPGRLKKELATLSRILKREVTRSRQHFLVLRLPDTYRRLIELDITDDYTMGYARQAGFRAGICTPFYFYDLDMERPTTLRIHPFAVMDATLRYYMQVSPAEAMNHIAPLIDEVRRVNGDFISLWHNESMSENKIWSGWRPVYEQMVAYATGKAEHARKAV